LGYLFKVKPYQEKKSNYQEIFNELCILAVACLLYGLTDQVTDFKSRMRVSWAIIFIIIAQVIVNLCLVIFVWINELRALYQKWKASKRTAKYDDKNVTELSDLKTNKKFTTSQNDKFNKASIKDFVFDRTQDEEIKEGEPVQDYDKLDNTDIGRPSSNMTP